MAIDVRERLDSNSGLEDFYWNKENIDLVTDVNVMCFNIGQVGYYLFIFT